MYNLDIIILKSIKIGVLISSYILFQVSELTGGIIDEAFDQLFSLGLLVIVVYLLYKDNREIRQYNRKKNEEVSDVVSKNTEALYSYAQALDNFSDVMRDIKDEMRELRAERHRNELNNQ